MGSEEVTRYTINDTSEILYEALMAIPPAKRQITAPSTLYGDGGAFMDVGMQAVMDRAAEILDKDLGYTEADAVELAFDSLLYAGTSREWERVGEVALIAAEHIARAYCLRKE